MFLCACGSNIPTDGTIAVVPKPASVAKAEGTLRLSRQLQIGVVASPTDNTDSRRLVDEANRLAEHIFGAPFTASGDTALTIDCTDKEIAAEGYRLTVAPDEIAIAASTPRGAFYGLETLRQLISAAGYASERKNDSVEIQC